MNVLKDNGLELLMCFKCMLHNACHTEHDGACHQHITILLHSYTLCPNKSRYKDLIRKYFYEIFTVAKKANLVLQSKKSRNV